MLQCRNVEILCSDVKLGAAQLNFNILHFNISTSDHLFFFAARLAAASRISRPKEVLLI